MTKERRDNKGRLLRTNEHQRSDGRYVYRYQTAGGETRYLYSWRLLATDVKPKGKRQCESLREKEAEAQYEKRWELKGLNSDERVTVTELVDKYIAIRTNVKPSTQCGYETVRSHLSREEFGTRKIDSITIADAKKWLISLQTNGKGYSTIHTIRGVVRQAFQMAVEDEKLERNPFDFKLDGVVINDMTRRESLSIMEEALFMAFVKNDVHFCRYYDMFFILLNTGVRIAELCGLCICDIDFERGYIVIKRTLNRFARKYVVGSTKTKSGFRKIPMSNDVKASVKRILDVREKQIQTVNIDGGDEFLFIDHRGIPLLPSMIQKYFQRVCEKIYNEKNYNIYVTPHICRHTFCTKMVREGMKPNVLQYIMGHSRIDTTLEYYAHVDIDMVYEEVDRIMNK
ncbi:tyrosine-type recombinase/integrase [Butyrivibrio sp. AD3002]|uniref:tyrosine-type recombinase/integrase n=1 Tax=Butyrivibrio sp. AD3002 TaxID=1280670 RepID=UPI0003B60FB6|nr:tyrosine-type recombinase/integrase [Butyrivibrio sp. AD3002]